MFLQVMFVFCAVFALIFLHKAILHLHLPVLRLVGRQLDNLYPIRQEGAPGLPCVLTVIVLCFDLVG